MKMTSDLDLYCNFVLCQTIYSLPDHDNGSKGLTLGNYTIKNCTKYCRTIYTLGLKNLRILADCSKGPYIIWTAIRPFQCTIG